jgi:hypothetical protein
LKKTKVLKSAYTESSIENVENLIEYLTKIGGKNLSIKCRRQNAFKILWTNKDIILLTKCHIQNAVDYLNSIKNNFSKTQIRILIGDLAKYVSHLDTNEDTSFILFSTNTQPSAIQFDSAKRLFYNHQIREQYQNNYSTDLLTLYAIRLSLENRIKGLLGIDYATNKGKIINLSTLIKISKGLKSVEYCKKINWDEIEWINNWLNHHMHRHIRPYPWIIHQSIEVLNPFIDPKEPLLKGDRKIYSFYSAAYVNDEKDFENEIESNLIKIYPDIEIKWLFKREIVVKK